MFDLLSVIVLMQMLMFVLYFATRQHKISDLTAGLFVAFFFASVAVAIHRVWVWIS